MNAIISVILSIALIFGSATGIGMYGVKTNQDFINNEIETIKYDEQLVPTIGKDGYYTFTTDRDFRIMQLTDIHLGGGFMCIGKDTKAINAVAAMITAEKPDLVIVTGDIAYPIPVQAGTVNNSRPAILFAELMEKLGVYWCLTFGNHDTEDFALYSRDEIADLYMNKDKYPHCLLQKGPNDVDGVGNYVINVKNTKGEITESLFMLDSQMYVKCILFGLISEYDCVHENQVKWYKNQLDALTESNGGKTPKSLMFMHIPVIEMKEAYDEYVANGFKDTENVKYIGGVIGENNSAICNSELNYGIFDAVKNSKSTQAMFFGHDHLNSFSVNYKGVDMIYGLSIDYLAYPGIKDYGKQRGCTMITTKQDGSYEYKQENYYQDKYPSVREKEKISLEDMYEIAK